MPAGVEWSWQALLDRSCDGDAGLRQAERAGALSS